MRIQSVEILNFRRLKSTHVDFDAKTTIFVGANNSGKTSAMTALRFFLVSPKNLSLSDLTIANWPKLDAIGLAWEAGRDSESPLEELLPTMDVWLDVPMAEIRHVVHILPSLDWTGELVGVRLQYRTADAERLKSDYLLQRQAAVKAAEHAGADGAPPLAIWPRSLTDFLNRELHRHIQLVAYTLDPTAKRPPDGGIAHPQVLPAAAVPLEKNPFEGLIQIDEIAAQRDFADAGARVREHDGNEMGLRKYKRRLSDQLRGYYDRHLDPAKSPSERDLAALSAMQLAELSFDARLEEGFDPAFKELQSIGYPGISNPKLKITTQLRAIDGLKHSSALQYEVAQGQAHTPLPLLLPEDYAGLGYQNLIAMVFMLMSFRDEWMQVGKARSTGEFDQDRVPPLHLVLVEEPEAHLHAQVQQVFINNAYRLLRNHGDLGAGTAFTTQLVVSTHSSHVAHEADFANLRYFRRRPAAAMGEAATTTVSNLSFVFGDEDETKRFVKRYLKATHCDLFFADGIIFVEGQAERILVPHFIRNHFPDLSRRYTSVMELGGSHAHKFAPLIDLLGVTTLVISDLDAVSAHTITNKSGGSQTVWRSAPPERLKGQRTANSVLKTWHPQKELVDELLDLTDAEHVCPECEGYQLYVTYQQPLKLDDGSEAIPRTFEDALVLVNLAAVASIEGSVTTKKVQEIVAKGLSGEDLQHALFELLKSAEKAAFALDCLMIEDPKLLQPPEYVRAGLAWFEKVLSAEVTEREEMAA